MEYSQCQNPTPSSWTLALGTISLEEKASQKKGLTKVDPDKGLRLFTANGITTSLLNTRVHIKQLGIWVEAWVLENSPLVLSASKLIEENGFDLAWKNATRKATLTKNGKRHALTISQGVPLLAVNK